MLYCGIGLVVFMLLTAYDTQKLRQIYAYYAATLSWPRRTFHLRRTDLYLDFINIFLYVVRLLGHEQPQPQQLNRTLGPGHPGPFCVLYE